MYKKKKSYRKYKNNTMNNKPIMNNKNTTF